MVQTSRPVGAGDTDDASGGSLLALRLLPDSSGIPSRYYQIYLLLRSWGVPEPLAQVGLLMRRIAREAIDLERLAALLGPLAADAAAGLAAARHVPRPSLDHMRLAWQLFTLACCYPAACVLKIAELLVQLRATDDSEIAMSGEDIVAAARACERLGMWEARNELLDVRARLADPHVVQRASALLDRSRTANMRFFEELQREMLGMLRANGIDARVERRPRPLYKIVEEGLDSARGGLPWTDVVLVLVDTRPDCYRALGAINSSYTVVGTRLRDYIGGPKENGYQAIHTVVEYCAAAAGERRVRLDVRIATPEMERYNKEGYLACLAGAPGPERPPAWLADRHGWLDPDQSGKVCVFTPRGEPIQLPRGATALDFAVNVHSDLGVYCRGALVNGLRVSLGQRLESGDICEVLIDPHGSPIDQRLLDLASTTAAKSRIRRVFQKDRPGAVRGEQILKEALARRFAEQEVRASMAAIEQHVAALSRWRGYQTVDAFYRAIARGEVAPDQVAGMLVEKLLLPRVDYSAVPAELRARARRVRLGQCCRPRPSHPAVALAIHGGHQIKIHAASCPMVSEPCYPIGWRPADEQAYVAEVLYESWDRPGLIHQVTSAVLSEGEINIRSFSADVPEPRLARVRFAFEARDRAQVERVRMALERLPERRYVDVQTVTLVDEIGRSDEALDNPYGPQPVGRWPLFVGRDAHVRQIVAHLGGRSGASHILVHGPKRIGKSSLLQHLSRYHLSTFTVPALLDLQSLPTESLRFPRLLAHIAELLLQKAGSRAGAVRLSSAAIERDPIGAFAHLLAELRARGDVDRFVVLIDELGVVLSRLRGSGLEVEFFDQWRALLNDERVFSHLAFVVAMPDSALASWGDGMSSPLRAGELGFPVRLSVLDDRDACDLITAPVLTHLAYTPDDLALLLRETGGHPYYIHLVCGQIITAVQAQQRRIGIRPSGRQAIDSTMVRAALDAVAGNPDVFHHVLADSSRETRLILREVAAITRDARPMLRRARLRARLEELGENLGEGVITRAVEQRPDLLKEENDRIGVRVALVARWLRRHA